jgi:replicative superfamily II helicase
MPRIIGLSAVLGRAQTLADWLGARCSSTRAGRSSFARGWLHWAQKMSRDEFTHAL